MIISKKLFPAAFVILLAGLFSCKQSHLKPGEGFIPVNGGKIWYSVSGNSDKTPILMLHGGPGSTSYYLNPLLDLDKERPVIVFDQLGCGRSDKITDTSLMTIDNHIDQIRKLLSSLDVHEFYLYGHSWGTMLGVDYFLKHPEGVKAMVLASPCLSAQRWIADADTLIASLPDSIQLILLQSREGAVQDSATLASAIDVYSRNFYTRKRPKSEDEVKSELTSGKNVYEYMWGKSEFSASGTLKGYDRTQDLGQINVPVLYTAGEYDAARPITVDYYHSLTPDSRFVIIEDAGHSTMHDNANAELESLRKFLKELEE